MFLLVKLIACVKVNNTVVNIACSLLLTHFLLFAADTKMNVIAIGGGTQMAWGMARRGLRKILDRRGLQEVMG